MVAIVEARARGVDVTCETCPQYLVLTDDDVERIGAAVGCAPPLRPVAEQAELWRHVLAGAQATLGLMLEAGHGRRGLPLGDRVRPTPRSPSRPS